ncbi:MAG: hypothetical protein HRT88_19285 [Lentisphaeraceae bacterium]|nr:hypothetical protein [Lentisphaeraceae bacterium]
MKKNRELIKQISALVLLIIMSFILIKIVTNKKFTSKVDSLKKNLRDADKKEKFLQVRNQAIPDITKTKKNYERASIELSKIKKSIARQSQIQKSSTRKKSFINIHSPREIQLYIGKILTMAEQQGLTINKFSNSQSYRRPLLSFELTSRFNNLSSFIDELDAMKHRVIISKLDIKKSPSETQLSVNLEIHF